MTGLHAQLVSKPTCFSSKAILCGALLVLFGSSVIAEDQDRDITIPESGMHNGFYYDFWTQRPSEASVTFGLREAGRFTAEWKDTFNWRGGIGWEPGSRDKVLTYSGTFNSRINQSSRNSVLGLYGWARKPQTEFYIVESYGSYNPASCSSDLLNTYGSYQSDGATYDIHVCEGFFAIALPGYSQYRRIFSVRNPKKYWPDVNGTITVANHFDAWESKGLAFDDLEFMIFSAEGFDSSGYASGNADITITDVTPPLNCGELDGVPICCDISADPDRDDIGTQNNGQMCAVTEATKGWYPPNPPDVLAAINVGGKDQHIEAGDIYYAPFGGNTGGSILIQDTDVIGGDGSEVYQTALLGNNTFEIPVSEQRISVELSFVEFLYQEPGKRVFSVTIEDQPALTDLDIYDSAGYMTLLKSEPFEVDVTDGSLSIAINSDYGHIGVLSSILVRKIDATSSSSSSSSSSSASSSSSTSSSSASSSSGNGSGNSGTSGGSSGWWLLAITGLLVARRRMLSQDASA
jgi:uncharacterized membrane protein YgcG